MTLLRKSFLLLFLLILAPAFLLQAGTWTVYPYTSTYQRVCKMSDQLYILKSGMLFRASASKWQFEKQLTAEDGLSGTDIVDISYSEEVDRLAVVYTDGTIDVISPDGVVNPIPDLANTPMMGTDKSIVSVREQHGQLYIITAYGFLIVDLRKELILQSFPLGFAPRCAWGFNGRWYYSTLQGIYYCPMTANPFAPDAWKTDDTPVIDQAFVFERAGVEQCWLYTNDHCIRKIVPNTKYSICCSSYNIKRLRRAGRYMLAITSADSLIVYDTDLGAAPGPYDTYKAGQVNSCHTTSLLSTIDVSPLSNEGSSLAMLFENDGILADSLVIKPAKEGGVGQASFIQTRESALQVISKQQNANINSIAITKTSKIGFSYVPALTKDYSYILSTKGVLTTYRPSIQSWDNYGTLAQNAGLCTHTHLCGVTSFVADPTYDSRFWYGTLEDGIVAIDKGIFQYCYDYSNTGSTGLVKMAAPTITRIGSLTFSPQGDLWCTNEGVIHLLVAKKASDDSWHQFQIPGLERTYGFAHLLHTTQANRHQLWGYQEMNYQVTNIFCYDYGSDMDNQKDDRSVYFSELIPYTESEGSKTGKLSKGPSFIPYYGRGIYESPLGAIWILNTSGLYSIDNPDSVFAHPGEVRTLMTDVIPTSMGIDSQKHVWIGTEDNGLYLLSADGRTQYDHLTSGNSPLPDNSIIDLAVDTLHSTLWVTTSQDIVAYQYDPSDYEEKAEVLTSAYCWPASVQVTEAGRKNIAYNPIDHPIGEQQRTAVTLFNLKDETTVTLQNSQSRTLLQSTALGGVLHIDTTQLPVGTYTLSGTDSNGYTGKLCTFQVTE